MIENFFSSTEEQTQRQENESEESWNKNEIRLLSPVSVYLVLVSILGISTTSCSLAPASPELEISNPLEESLGKE